jgi:DedD protein
MSTGIHLSMLTRPESANPAVEELKRRARRRLVGAIVLALAAAVILPLLLESDPKPLGDDVSIQIPPIDSGKFITPLSPAKGVDGKAPPDRSSPGTARPATPTMPAKPAASAPESATGASPPSVADGKSVDTVQQAAPNVATPAAPTGTGSVAANPEAQKPAAPAISISKAQPGDTRPEVTSATGGFVVQLAAFADAKAAPALATKLKSAGFPAYTETFKTHQGTMQRVRVGPYATRDVADAELARLNAAGYRGVVATK